MLTLFTIVGIVMFIAAAIMLFIRPQLLEVDEPDNPNSRYQARAKAPDFLLWWNPKKSLIFLVIGFLFINAHGLLFNVPLGHSASLQKISGTQVGVTSPGHHYRGYSSITLWKNFFTVKFVTVNDTDNTAEKNVTYSGMRPAIGIFYNDAVRADVTLSVRAKLPTDPKLFLKMALEFRNQENLINSTVLPTIKNIVENTGYIYSAQEYMAGRAGEMKQDILYQLQNGNYILKRKKYADLVASNIVDSTMRKTPSERKEIVRDVSEKQENSDGSWKVRLNSLQANGIEIIQAPVESIVMESTFRKLLQKQRDQSALANLAKQKAQTAEFEKQRIVAEGEVTQAQSKVDATIKQVTALIQIETATKSELEKVKQEEAKLKVVDLQQKQKERKADATFYENRKLVSAGLTPQEKEKFRNARAVGVAAELAKTKWPTTYFAGGGSGGKGNMLTDLLGADYASKMLNTSKK